jgi:hypothetical protein
MDREPGQVHGAVRLPCFARRSQFSTTWIRLSRNEAAVVNRISRAKPRSREEGSTFEF